MTSIIIIGDHEKANDYIIQNYHPKDFFIHQLKPETSNIKLKQIHQVKKQSSTVPSKKRLIWIRKAEKLTSAAQNALLKLLEEPPKKTSFILETTNLQNLLPTIKSRCLIKRVGKQELLLNQQVLQQIKKAMKETPGKRIETAHSIGKKRSEAIAWTEEIINSLHKTLKTTQNPKSLKLLNQMLVIALKAKDDLQKNTNVTLTLEDFFLSLPEIQ